MNNITKEDLQADKVVEAYKKTGIIPIRSMFVGTPKNCGCALTATIMLKNGLQLRDVSVVDHIYVLDGDLSGKELDSFYRGFDDIPFTPYYDEEFYQLGVKAAEAVVAEFGEFPHYNDLDIVK